MIVISVGGSGIPEVTFRPLPFAEHRTFAKRSHVKDRKGFDMTYFGSTRVVDQASAHSLPRIFTVAGLLTKESGKQRIAAVSSVESPLRRVRIRLRTPPSSPCKPRVSEATPNRAFLRGFPRTQFLDFCLCGRSRICRRFLAPCLRIQKFRSRRPGLRAKSGRSCSGIPGLHRTNSGSWGRAYRRAKK